MVDAYRAPPSITFVIPVILTSTAYIRYAFQGGYAIRTEAGRHINDVDIKAGSQPGSGRPRLLDSLRESMRIRHYSRRTEKTYLQWIKRFIVFSGKQHPRELGAAEVTAFLNHVALQRHVAASTQNQALAALLFLYKEVLGEPLLWLDDLVHAKRPIRWPMVLTMEEAQRLLKQILVREPKWLMASLLYGAGLRLRGTKEARHELP